MARQRKEGLIDNIPTYSGIGIYAIVNNTNGRMYIGSSKNIRQRLLEHERAFRKGTCNKAFKEDIAQGHRFSVRIIVKMPYGVNRFQLFEAERKYADQYGTFDGGYNTENVPSKTKEDFEEHIRMFCESEKTWEKTKIEMTEYLNNIIAKYSEPILP